MTREIVPKRKIRYPMGLERDYAKLLTAYVARKIKVASAFIPEMKAALQTSNMTGHINVVLDQMEQAMESADVMTGTMQKMARLIEAHTEKETDAEFRSVFSLSAPLLPGLLKNQPVTNIGRQDAAFPDLEELKQAWVDQNLDLIRSIDRQTLERIKQQLNDAIIYNSDAAELTKFLTEAIQEIAHNETNRAVLIATDQIGKLHGRMSQYRQEQAGITHYIWETAHDSRVRPWHRTRQGKKFAWSNPPPDGHPGIPIRCRCVALPVIDVDKIPIRVKPGTFISAINVVQNPPESDKINIESTTTKLKATLPDDEYQEYLNLVQSNKDIERLYTKADGIDTLSHTKYGGSYSAAFNRIEWSYPDSRYINNGMHKFSTLAHEYGHYFDARLTYQGVTHEELNAINDIITHEWAHIPIKASSSDKFLKAIRKDMPNLKKRCENTAFRTILRDDDSSSGLQDAIDGLFPNSRIGWGHGEKYYNRKYRRIIDSGDYKALKDAFKKLGFEVRRKSDVMQIVRQYEAASEIWANLSSGVTVSPKELRWFKNYMPHTYRAYLDIIKEADIS